MKFVDFNSIGVRSKMEADCNELNDDLLDKVQGEADQQGDQDLVHGFLPLDSDSLGMIRHVVGHRRQEGDLNSKPPEE